MVRKWMAKLDHLYVVIGIIALWYIGSKLNWWSSFILPSPEKVLATTGKLLANGQLIDHVAISVLRIVIGFGITAVLAIPLGVIFGLNSRLYRYVKPLFEFMRNTPPLALVPMLILWFGIGEKSKIILIVLASFFPIFLNTQKGVSRCDTKLLEVGTVFQLSRLDKFKKIILPYSLPDILLGLKMGIGYSWRSIIGAEMIAASSGLGYLILDGQQLSRSDVVIVGIIVIGLLGLLSDYLFGKVVKSVSKGSQMDDE